jgi:hypothetical protein
MLFLNVVCLTVALVHRHHTELLRGWGAVQTCGGSLRQAKKRKKVSPKWVGKNVQNLDLREYFFDGVLMGFSKPWF